jgi:hypothetical protein
MAEPFYRVGELRGPFEVVSVTFDLLPDGRYLEVVKDSMGNGSTTLVKDEKREFYSVSPRPFGSSILVPYTIRHPKTEAGLEGQDATWVNVSGSPYDYWRVLCEWWKDDFCIVEHDVAANPGIFTEFERCTEPWCTGTYSNFRPEDIEAWKYGILGCTRFRSELIQSLPNALRDLGWRYRDWHVMSTGLGIALRESGYEPHLHGTIDHHRMMDVGGITEAVRLAS